jgi:molybdopterin-biosynthesis enzyme MoeA-like protein
MKAVAKAFDMKLKYHEPTIEMMRKHITGDINESRKRMALFPENAIIYTTPDSHENKQLWVIFQLHFYMLLACCLVACNYQ